MKLFVWDFHGVLEKGNENAVLEISNKILEKFGYKERFTPEINLKLYGVKWFKYFEELLPYESNDRHIQLQRACMEYEAGHPTIIESYIKPNDYAHEVLTKIKEKHGQILISNMAKMALARFLKSVKITKFFPNGNAFANNSHKLKVRKSKSEVLKEYLAQQNFDQIITIGDRAEDMILKNVAEGVSYLYAHPGRNFPPSKEADYKINDLREVLREV